MNRRKFLRYALVATASGLLVPEWILDPPKGRSMVSIQMSHGGVVTRPTLVRFGDGGPETIIPLYRFKPQLRRALGKSFVGACGKNLTRDLLRNLKSRAPTYPALKFPTSSNEERKAICQQR